MTSNYRVHRSNSLEQPVLILLPEDESSAPIGEFIQSSESSNTKDEHATKKNRKTFIFVATVAILVLIAVAVAVVSFLFNMEESSFIKTVTASPNVTLSPTFLCPEKTLKITHICEVPDLDTGPDSTMDIKVLVDSQHHWPQNLDVDCFEEYGSYEDTCVLPDTYLTFCIELANSPEWVVDNKTLENTMIITIYETDIIFDDSIDIFVYKDHWYNGDECYATEYVFNSTSTSASIRMSVSPKQAPNKGSDASSPTQSPMH